MKKSKMGFLNLTIIGVGLFLILSCEGPPGPPGADGADGVNIVGTVFEIAGTFNAQGNFGLYDEFGFEVLESDKILIYRLDGVDDDLDVWRLLPQIVFHQNGIFNYSFDFTQVDYTVFMEGNFDLTTLGAEWTNDQVFRVLVVPADFLNARLDLADHDAMIKLLGVDTSDIPRIMLN
jgi:hypothetical protein